jgi:hypothetical protein
MDGVHGENRSGVSIRNRVAHLLQGRVRKLEDTVDELRGLTQ